jgi:hypothetical protein
MGSRDLCPSITNTGKIKSSIERVFSRISLRVDSSNRIRRGRDEGKRLLLSKYVTARTSLFTHR